MSNHLRELLDCKTIMAGECPSLDFESRVLAATKKLHESASRAICFYLGDARDVASIDSASLSGMAVDLPYKTCWFEFDVHVENRKPFVFGVMADAGQPGEAYLAAFQRSNDQWGYLFTGSTHDNMIAMTAEDNFQSVLPEIYKMVLGVIRTALCAMKCVNIHQVESVPSEKLQKARLARGKKPLFSFWTLEISIPNVTGGAGRHCGGTHASPRLHLRRGHVREYRPGMFCWIQPHAVGNKKLGIIHKEYSAHYDSLMVPN